MNNILPSIQSDIISVSEINQRAKFLLESQIGLVWISGEISNLSQPTSGHCYFSLKDSRAQIRCACFKRIKSQLNFELKNGQQVIVQANASLYTARGDYQLIANQVILAGDGLLQLKFNQLKALCTKRGWFAPEKKQPIPKKINTLGIITSSTGAALQDILKVLKRRAPLLSIIIYPSLVQGEQAADSLCRAINIANQRQECECLLLARGGGSLEDLWCFNSEVVAESLHKCTIPVITGIGHETDSTIADFTADLRAATPSAAAELASPDYQHLLSMAIKTETRLHRLISHYLSMAQHKFRETHKRLKHPKDLIQENAQRLDHIDVRLKQQILSIIQLKKTQLEGIAKNIHSLSPLNTLDRGYAIIQDSNNKIISSTMNLIEMQNIEVRLRDGYVKATINKIKQNKEKL